MKKFPVFVLMLLFCFHFGQEKFVKIDTISIKNILDLEAFKIHQVTDKEIKFLISKSPKKFKLVYTYTHWCKPCKEKFPKVIDFVNRHQNDVEVIYLNDIYRETDVKNTYAYLTSIKNTNHPIFTLYEDDRMKNNKGKVEYLVFNEDKNKLLKANRYDYYIQKLVPNHKFYGYSLIILFDEFNNPIYASTYNETKEQVFEKLENYLKNTK